MPTEKARYTIAVDDVMLDEIEKYRYEHRLPSKNSATVELLRRGMDEFNRRAQAEDAKRNKTPTAESAAEALYEVLYYYLGHPPTMGEIDAFRGVMPVISKGIDGVA